MIERGPDGRIGPPQRNDAFREVIDTARRLGMLDQLLLSPAARDYDHADEVRRGLQRSAWYYCSCGEPQCTRRHDNIAGCPDGGQRISVRGSEDSRTGAEIVTTEGAGGRKNYHVQFQLHDKREAIRAMILKYGPDRSKWPYDPRQKQLKGKSNGHV
jgi:hypothetical protein